jgi:hypothetical protein
MRPISVPVYAYPRKSLQTVTRQEQEMESRKRGLTGASVVLEWKGVRYDGQLVVSLDKLRTLPKCMTFGAGLRDGKLSHCALPAGPVGASGGASTSRFRAGNLLSIHFGTFFHSLWSLLYESSNSPRK